MNDYLTLADLADRWSVNYNALLQRKHRGELPEPDRVYGRSPVWAIQTIEDYERETRGDTERNTPA